MSRESGVENREWEKPALLAMQAFPARLQIAPITGSDARALLMSREWGVGNREWEKPAMPAFPDRLRIAITASGARAPLLRFPILHSPFPATNQ